MANEAPGAFGYLWFQQKLTKGAIVVLVVVHWLTIASVRMLRINFLWTSLVELSCLRVTESTCATDAQTHFLRFEDEKRIWSG